MKDIQLRNGDLVINARDFALVEGDEFVLQEVIYRLNTPHFRWALDFTYGSDLPGAVNSPESRWVDVVRSINDALSSDPYVSDWYAEEREGSVEVEVMTKTGGVIRAVL